MPHFSNISKERLQTCVNDLRVLFGHVIQNYDCTIVEGHRGKERQNKAYAEGKSQLRWPNSKHNKYPSLAVDAAPYEKRGIDWSYTQMAFFAGYVLGIADQLYATGVISHKIRAGIDWNGNRDIDDETFKDAPHFEIILNEDEL